MRSEFIEREPPLGPLYLVANVRRELPNAEVAFVDAHAERLDTDELFETVRASGCDYLCVSSLTIGITAAYELIRRVRATVETQSMTIIMGGVHATALPHECLDQGADYVVVGEGEQTLVELLRTLPDREAARRVCGIVYRSDDGTPATTSTRKLIDDLSLLPAPAFDLIKRNLYDTTIHMDTGQEALPIMMSRGCAYDCPFCVSKLMWRRKIRFRRVDEAVDELERLECRGVKEFHFYDDDFLVGERFARDVAQAIVRRGLQIRFTCLSTCRSFLKAQGSTLTLLKEAGLQLIEFGIESLIPEVLSEMQKSYQVEELEPLVDKLIEHGLHGYPLLIYLAIGESLHGHMEQAQRFEAIFGRLPYVREHMDVASDVFLRDGSAYAPLPGTALWRQARTSGIVVAEDWDRYDTKQISFVPNSLLDDVPVRMQPVTPRAERRFNLFAPRALRLTATPAEINSNLETVGRLADGTRSIRRIAAELQKEGNAGSLEEALTFTVLATLTLLLNDVVEPAFEQTQSGHVTSRCGDDRARLVRLRIIGQD